MKKVRNAVARLPIMKKGGVHDKTNKAKRKKQKQKLQKQIRTNNFGPFLFLLIYLGCNRIAPSRRITEPLR
ncbi:MAG TPA: hypothetical protein ENJ44_01300 [Oceanospirillales bacterium]|nr:hypothetical protein [Oceanospirillales bacterium]